MALGEGGAADCVADLVADLDAVLVFGQCRLDPHALAVQRGAHVFQVAFDDGPEVARRLHLRVVVVEAAQQGAAGQFEILDVVAVPGDVHGVHVVERDLDVDAGGKQKRIHSVRGWMGASPAGCGGVGAAGAAVCQKSKKLNHCSGAARQ